MSNCGITRLEYSSKGRLAALPNCRSGKLESIRTLKEKSFCTEGPKLFNALPRCICDCTLSKDTFKSLLDSFLELLPDQPAGREDWEQPGAFNNSDRPTNSIHFWVRTLNLSNWVRTNTWTSLDLVTEEQSVWLCLCHCIYVLSHLGFVNLDNWCTITKQGRRACRNLNSRLSYIFPIFTGSTKQTWCEPISCQQLVYPMSFNGIGFYLTKNELHLVR